MLEDEVTIMAAARVDHVARGSGGGSAGSGDPRRSDFIRPIEFLDATRQCGECCLSYCRPR